MTTSPSSHQERQIAIPDGPALLTAYQQATACITALEEENAVLRMREEKTQQENATLRQDLLAERQEKAALRQEIHWIAQLLAVPAKVLSPSQKVTLRAATQAIGHSTPDDQELIQIESWKLCQTVGQSKDTSLDNLKYLSENVGVLRKKTQRVVDEEGNYTTNLSIGATDLITRPDLYQAEKPRNHGGERLLCPHCQSDRLQKKVTITCICCGTVLDEHTSQVNKEEPDQPSITGTVLLQKRQDADSDLASFFDEAESDLTTSITRSTDRQVDDSEQGTPDGSSEQEPVTPPVAIACHVPTDPTELMEAAAALLVAIAGPVLVHIEMSAKGPKKYYDVARALSLQDARDHLAGKKTKGAMIRYPDGTTRALCYDADNDNDWERLRDAARLLSYAGYAVIVEDSPAGRGGHLWIIFTDLVNARCAHRHVCELAPMLTEIKECWPGSGNHKVRLPGWRYVRPGFAQQCKLYNAIGALLAETRADAARALLQYQTPATIVPNYPPEPSPIRCATHQLAGSEISRNKRIDQRPAPEPDTRWEQKYHDQAQHLWFQFTPKLVAAWYNERHAIKDLLPPERNGMGLAAWRGERTASVGYTKDGEGWVDFGATARRTDGKQDGGDALELQARLTGSRKKDVMRQAARDMVKEARIALESAAREGKQPPPWVEEILTPAGRAHYREQLLRSATAPTHEALVIAEVQPAQLFVVEAATCATRGVTGSHSDESREVQAFLSLPPPARASYCCGSWAWMWDDIKERYVCGACHGKQCSGNR